MRVPLHVLTCEECGLERRSAKRPTSKHAPKRCAQCNRERARIALASIMGRPLLAERRVRAW